MHNDHTDEKDNRHLKYIPRPENHPLFSKFSDIINLPQAPELITSQNPWVCFSQEFGVSDLPSAGGLGYLAGDWMLLSGKLGIPYCGVGLYYRTRWRQELDKDYMQKEHTHYTLHPSHFKFKKLEVGGKYLGFPIVANGQKIDIDIFVKNIKGNLLIMLYESGLKGLYEGESWDEHRLYQSAVLGFGGMFALYSLGLIPSVLHLNESSTVIAAIALLDRFCLSGANLFQSLEKVRERTIFTNHTLSPAAEPVWHKNQLERYLYKNLRCDIVRDWVAQYVESFKEGVAFSDFAYMFAGKVNAVSAIHAREAGKSYKRTFHPITNGVSVRWINTGILDKFKELHILDREMFLQSDDYFQKLKSLKTLSMIKLKDKTRHYLKKELAKGWHDQYGQHIQISKSAKIVVWARRFDSYKRPGLIFHDLGKLSNILEKHDLHFIISGRAHPTDTLMKKLISDTIKTIDSVPVLKERVHYIANYGWRIARFLVSGADIWVNTPVVGTEACGTSWEKAIMNWALLCSTADGGVADIFESKSCDMANAPLLLIDETKDDGLSARSLYENLEKGGEILSNSKLWHHAVIRQLEAYLPICNGSRMMGEYLTFALGK